jgi:4-hydroxythreonine-4-phosphate dehydrogenase
VLEICEPVVIGPRDATGFHLGKVHPDNGRAALESARAAIRGALDGEYAAVAAAPHSEAAIRAAGIEFDGYPSFVARTCGLPPEAGILMLCFPHEGREVRIAHVTLHARVLDAVRQISVESVLRTLRAASDFGRIAVSGLNPHAAGEEEERIIAPALAAARAEGIAVEGPIGADTLLQRKDCEAYVVMLHDQGHVAAKVLAPNGAAALTLGTPVLFSSVAHGTAFDIAGQDRADPRAMVEAITRLVGRRRRASQTKK